MTFLQLWGIYCCKSGEFLLQLCPFILCNKHTSYEYKDDIGSGGGGKGNFHLNENGYINLSESGGKNINIRREDETFKMTIEWNGKKETFSIKSLNNKNTDAVAEKAPDYTANEQRQTCGAVPYLVDQQHKNKT